MTRWAYCEISRTCGGCGRPLPVNGPLQHVRCASCFTTNPVPLLMFQQVFEIIDDGREDLSEGETRSQTPLGAGGTYKLTWGGHPPRCNECGAVLPEPGAREGDFSCPGCGAICKNFAPPEPFAKLYPATRQIVLGDRETAATPEAAQQVSVDQTQVKPILMACSECGGGLSIDADTPKIHDCQYCGARVGIPDDLWERLHPVESTRGWYVRLDGDLGEPERSLSERIDERFDQESLALDKDAPTPEEGPSRWARLQIHTKCPSCKHPIPINGPLPHVVCPECSAVKKLPAEIIGGFMSWVGDTQPMFDGNVFRSGGQRFKKKCARVPASCRQCGARLVAVEHGTDSIIDCPGCSAKYETFPVPAPYEPHAGHARQIYCGQKQPDPVPSEVPSSLKFSCASCGAQLNLTAETGRVHRCEFCSSDVFIPDELWTQLHPVARVHPWFVDALTTPPSPEPDDDDTVSVPPPSTHRQRNKQMGKSENESGPEGQDTEKKGLILIFGAVGVILVISLIVSFFTKC